MASMDVFSADAFTMTSMSAAINLLPHKPRLLGSIPGLFTPKPIRTTNTFIDSKEGKLAILPTAPRGTVGDGNVNSQPDRRARNFVVPYVPKFMAMLANDIQDLRAFGSDSELATVAMEVNDRLRQMKDEHETTHEYHRVGALKGTVLDGDASTVIYNFYTEFGTSQQTSDWTTSTGDPNLVMTDVIRKIGAALGNATFGQIIGLCGDTYFDQVTIHAKTKTAWERWNDGDFLRTSHLSPDWYSLAARGFMLQNVLLLNYRGLIGNVTFIPATEAYFFPTGVPDMFLEVMAPADTMETVNTLGKRFYAFQERMRFNKGVELHTSSSVLMINTRPRAVVKSTVTVA